MGILTGSSARLALPVLSVYCTRNDRYTSPRTPPFACGFSGFRGHDHRLIGLIADDKA
jgi:hypothetical protein